MSYCINPHCSKPVDPANVSARICRNCGSDILLQGRYRVLKQIGKGGFGDTFTVDDRGTVRVLKVLTENNSKAIELFQQEAKVLSQLNSLGIPQVELGAYFTIVPKDSPVPLHCLVMEKIEGVDLQVWMESRNHQPISQGQALNWIKQLVEILSLVHARQYFHRDIKPQNIMLRTNGQLVLIDFGAVRQVTATIISGGCHTKIASEGYSPPEQQNGHSVQQSDFFALGRTFVFLLTGKQPHDCAIYDPLNNEMRWRHHAPHISPNLADLIDRLIALNASQRPRNTQAIRQGLIEIEQALNMNHSLSQQTKPLSSAKSGTTSKSSQPTMKVGNTTPNKTSPSQIQNPPKSSHVFASLFQLGLAFSGIACIAAFNSLTSVNSNTPSTPISVTTPNQNSLESTSAEIPHSPLPAVTPSADPLLIVPITKIHQQPIRSSTPSPSQETVTTDPPYSTELEKPKSKPDGAVLTIERSSQPPQANQSQHRPSSDVNAQQEKLEAEKRDREREVAEIAQNKRKAALIAEQERIAAVQAERARLAATARMPPLKTSIPKRQEPPRRQEIASSSNSGSGNTTQPWNSKAPIKSATSELENVIREGKK